MGYSAPSKHMNSALVGKPTDHILIDPSGGMLTKDSIELRFRATSQQIRDGAYPLHMAVQAKAPVGVLELLIKEADEILENTNKFGETPLHLALKNGDDTTVELLLACNAKVAHMPDKKGNLPIHIAVASGCSVRVAKDLLELYAESIHVTNAEGMTPIQKAQQQGRLSEEVLRLLAITDHAAQA